ncbi:MAG: hypothetical protein ACE5QW_05500 [Thermoplasmata archaeon]
MRIALESLNQLFGVMTAVPSPKTMTTAPDDIVCMNVMRRKSRGIHSLCEETLDTGKLRDKSLASPRADL